MRTLIRWAARLYPPAWRNRYAAEFDALLDDISPSFGDMCDVLGDVPQASRRSGDQRHLSRQSELRMSMLACLFFMRRG